MLRRGQSNPLPARARESRSLWALNGLPRATARELEQWLDALRDVPLEAWIRIGDRCASREYDLTTTRACRRVDRAVAEQELEVSAWLVRDLVETATDHLRHESSGRPRSVRAQIAVGRMAAEWAALAIACQTWLQPADRDLLCAPFARPARRQGSATA
jgi:hypothetical protein